MKLIGLTGGIGCGKTTVLEVFESLGVPCFIADKHASEYYRDSSFLEKIRSIFGDKVFDNQGNVDKKAIAAIVFSDHTKLEELNAIIHPRVMNDFRQWASTQNAPYVIFESAIIFEYGLEKHLDAIIAVYLEKEERMRRIENRDKVGRDAIEARMRNQLSAESKMDRADFVILNYEGNPRLRQVKHIDQWLRSSYMNN